MTLLDFVIPLAGQTPWQAPQLDIYFIFFITMIGLLLIFVCILDPGGGFTSETAGRYVAVSEVKRLQIYNGYIM
jgi:hypothetical protein